MFYTSRIRQSVTERLAELPDLSTALPAVYRPVVGRIQARLPYDRGNRYLLREICGVGTRPDWTQGRWEIARTHYGRLVEGLVAQFGEVHVTEDYNGRQFCDTRCQEATGDDCVCRCLGASHGHRGRLSHWILVGETTLVSPDKSLIRRQFTVTGVEGGGAR